MPASRFGLLLSALLLVAVRPAAAANLIASGQFDQPVDIDSWTVTPGGNEAAMSFEAFPDEHACVGSGSALLVTTSPGERDVEYSVCSGDFVGGGEQAVGLEVLFPGGEGQGRLFWGATWYDGPDCTGAEVSSVWAGPMGYAPGWQVAEFWVSTFPQAVSARVQVWVSSLGTPEPFHLNVDRVFVRPVDEVFADDFELGELCRWDVGTI